jgi:hypothetical protein
VDKPAVKNYKTMFYSLKNAGKTRILRTMAEFNRNNKLAKLKKYHHLWWLMVNGHVDEIDWVEGLDGEGKGDVNKDKFDGAHFRNRPIFYENGPMPVMQNPVAFVREVVLFMKATKWAYLHPDLYKQKTGKDAPSAAVFENLSILANQIMDYVRTIAHDDKIKKLEEKGQELGGPLVKKFDNWDLRNRNWDFLGGFIQCAFPLAFSATARSRFKWADSEPTDTEEAQTYAAANFAYNIIVLLYRVDDEQKNTRHFFAKIISSDFMEPGTMYPIIENPDYFKIIAEVCKYSHRKILDKYGKWVKTTFKNGDVIDVWVENDAKPVAKPVEKAPATAPIAPIGNNLASPEVTPVAVHGKGGDPGAAADSRYGRPTEKAGDGKAGAMPSVAAIKKVIAEVNMKTATAKPTAQNGNQPPDQPPAQVSLTGNSSSASIAGGAGSNPWKAVDAPKDEIEKQKKKPKPAAKKADKE